MINLLAPKTRIIMANGFWSQQVNPEIEEQQTNIQHRL